MDETTPLTPRAGIRVGVTGHRPVRDKYGNYKLNPERVPELSTTTGDILKQIASAADSVRTRHADQFGAPRHDSCVNDTGIEGVVASCLAAGADQIVAQAGLAMGYRLEAILPFDADEYRHDHASTETTNTYDALLSAGRSRFALDGTREAEGRAYEAAGLVMLANADILIAIWNGEPAAGRGGTAEIVERAVADGMPVVLIHPGAPKEACIVWTGLQPISPETIAIEDVARQPLDIVPTVVSRLMAMTLDIDE